MAPAERLEIRVLGELELVRGGASLALPASKKTRALLGYLVVTARPQLRERLCELLWDGPDDPRAALRWSLHKLRPLIDDETTRLVADREHVGVALEGVDVDLAAVRAAAAPRPADADLGALRTAAARFRGDLLDGTELRDCLHFHGWLTREREAIRTLRSAMLSALADRLLDEPEESLRWAHERLAFEPLEEAAHLQVARALDGLGRTREALGQLEACRGLLLRELGAEVSGDVERMRRSLLGRSGARAARPRAMRTPGPTPSRAGSPTLVGRAAELELLSQHLAAPAPGMILLEGEPGIGKSRLLAELAARARASGRAVLAGRSYQAETVRPYGAWIDALRAAPLPELAEHRRADLALLLPELGPPPATADRHRLFDAVAEVIRGHQPAAVVILDDVQWLDEVSAALLHYLARAGGPVLFALAARAGELEDNAPVLRMVRACARENRLTRRSIARLTAEETFALARQVAPGVDAGAVHGESAGNPLFVLEVARAGGAGTEGLPPSLDGLIAERLAELDPRLVEIVGVAAALGTAFTLDGLARALAVAPAALLDGVEELERRGVLRSVAGGFDFEHDLVRRGAYLRLSPLRRRHLHLQIARGLETVALGDGALAHHAALGGDHELAARACVAAGERALRVFAHAEAVALAQRGRIHLATLTEPSRTVQNLRLLQIDVMARIAGRVMPGSGSAPNTFVELRSELGRAAAGARAVGLSHETAVAYRLLANLRYEEGDRDGTLRYLDAAMEMGRDGDAASAAADLAMNGRCLAQLEGNIGSARHCLAEAAAICAKGGLDLGELHWGLGLLARWDGDTATARTLLERALGCFRRDQDRWRECTLLACLAMLELELGGAAALTARMAELGPMAARMGEGSELPFASALDALAGRLAGAPDADQRLDAALDELRRVDSRAQLAYILDHAAALDLGAGRLADARRHAAEGLLHAETVGRKSENALARAVLAETARRAGATAEARSALEPALALLAGADALPVRVVAAITEAGTALGLSIPTPTSTAAATRNR